MIVISLKVVVLLVVVVVVVQRVVVVHSLLFSSSSRGEVKMFPTLSAVTWVVAVQD
jgi:hypothetical protein